MKKRINQEFNPNSTQQLAKLLQLMGYILTIHTEKGTNFSTDEDTLKLLVQNNQNRDNSFVKKLLNYREYTKQLSTYIKPLIEKSDNNNNCIYPQFHQTVVSGNRLSSSGPNIQNISKHSEHGKKIRKAFIPYYGHSLVIADFSQLQLRILAHYSQDQVMLNAYNKNIDIHQLTATSLGVERQTGKTINFALSFGAHANKLHNILKEELSSITKEDCEKYVLLFKQTYKGLFRWINYIVSYVEVHGHCPSLYGFKRPLKQPENVRERFYFEHCCVNTPIMASESQLVKRAMIRVYQKLGIVPLWQIHDDLTFLIEDSKLDEIVPKIKLEMENDKTLSVPLVCDIKICKEWC